MSLKCPRCGSTQIKSSLTSYPKQESDKNTAVMILIGAIFGSIIPVLGTVLGAIAGWLTGEVMRIFASGSYLVNRCTECGYSWHHEGSFLENEQENLTTKPDCNLTISV